MIITDRTITVRKGVSSIDDPVIVYRGDYEVSIRFTIMNSKFKFISGVNMIESEKATYAQLAILTPYGGNVFSAMVRCSDGTVTFVMTKELMDQIEEVGLYSFQIRLFDGNRESRISIPPVEFGIEVREPVASEDHDNEVNNAIVGYSIAKVVDELSEDVPDTFDANGQYNKTDWETGDRISEGKLNKIEDALDEINQNEKNDVAALDKRVTNNFNVLNSNKADVNYVDTKINAVASGAPKGIYDNLASLQSAIPKGNADIYITSDNGHWNYWNGANWVSGGAYQSVILSNDSVGMEHIKNGVKTLNLCTHDTVIMDRYVNTNSAIVSMSDTAYAKIPVKPNCAYIFGRCGSTNEQNSINNGDPFCIIDINGEVVQSDRTGTYYKGTDNNGVKYARFFTPENSAFLCVNLWVNGFKAIDTSYCYEASLMESDIVDISSLDYISEIFDIALRDEHTLQQFNDFKESVIVADGNIYGINTRTHENQLVETGGFVTTADGWKYADVAVKPNTTYSIYFGSNNYSTARGTMQFQGINHNRLSYIRFDSMISNVVTHTSTSYKTFTTPDDCYFIAFSVVGGKSNDYLINDAETTVIKEGMIITSDDLYPFVKEIYGKKVFRPNDVSDYIDIPSIQNTWEDNLLQHGTEYIENSLYNLNGTLQTAVGWTAANVSIIGGNRYYYYSTDENFNYKYRGKIIFMDANANVIETVEGESLNTITISDKTVWVIIDTPSDASFIGLSAVRPDSYDDRTNGVILSRFPEPGDTIPLVTGINGMDIYSPEQVTVQSTWDNNMISNGSGSIQYGALYNNSGMRQNAYDWALIDIPVRGGLTYYFYSPSQSYNTGLRGNMVLIDSSNNIIQSIEGQGTNTYTPDGSANTWQVIKTTSDTAKVGITIIHGSGAYNDVNVGVFMEEEPTKAFETNVIHSINNIPLNTLGSGAASPLYGKKWVVIGDSLTEKNIRATKNYHHHISDETGVTVVNMGVSGTGYMRQHENNRAFYQRILNIPADADIITIFGSGNDLSQPLGTPSDTGTDTICGCMRKTFENLFSVIPGAKVGVVLPCPWGGYPPSTKDNKMALYCEALKEIAGEYSIPVLDLYHGSNLRPWDPTFRDLYYKHDDGGSVHPDEDGHKILANKFKMFIQSL